MWLELSDISHPMISLHSDIGNRNTDGEPLLFLYGFLFALFSSVHMERW